MLTGHQGLQVVSAHVVRRSLVDLLRHPLQKAHWNIPERHRDTGGRVKSPNLSFIIAILNHYQTHLRHQNSLRTHCLTVGLLLKYCISTSMSTPSLFLYPMTNCDEYCFLHVGTHLHMKESHSNMKVRVFSTPRVSEPQCSRPKLVKSLRTSSRSLDEMSQCLLSFISVKIQGLMRAPLKRANHNKS